MGVALGPGGRGRCVLQGTGRPAHYMRVVMMTDTDEKYRSWQVFPSTDGYGDTRDGLDVIDLFAAAALVGFIANEGAPQTVEERELTARLCYQAAAALVAEGRYRSGRVDDDDHGTDTHALRERETKQASAAEMTGGSGANDDEVPW
jgi:hypothetical protein